MLLRPFTTRAVALVCTLALATTGAACGGDDDQPRSTPTTTAPATTTTDAEPTDEEQIEQLEHEWFDLIPSIITGDQPVDAASAFIAADYLVQFVAAIDGLREQGVTIRPSSESALVIESIDLSQDGATVTLCTKDSSLDVDAGTGEVIHDEVSITRHEDTLERSGDRWKIVSRDNIEQLPAGEECPEGIR